MQNQVNILQRFPASSIMWTQFRRIFPSAYCSILRNTEVRSVGDETLDGLNAPNDSIEVRPQKCES